MPISAFVICDHRSHVSFPNDDIRQISSIQAPNLIIINYNNNDDDEHYLRRAHICELVN